MPKQKRAKHAPLDIQMRSDQTLEHTRPKQRGKGAAREEKRAAKDAEAQQFLSDRMSQKILKEAASQLKEERAEEVTTQPAKASSASASFSRKGGVSRGFGGRVQSGGEVRVLELDELGYSSAEEPEDTFSENEEEYDEFIVESESKLSAADRRALDMFMSNKQPERQSIADMIMQKVRQKEHQSDVTVDNVVETIERKHPPELVALYRRVGKFMHFYSHGRVPKPFKIIPTLQGWDEVLFFTDPDRWSGAAVYEATKIFSSNLNAAMCQQFYSMVLYPRVRNEISENKKLNYHVYQALKKALFKPAAFFKGVLLPLCETQNCTHREALVLASVIQKVSIPWKHSAAALLKIAGMPYSGGNSIFIQTLLNKKYALPYMVVDQLVMHFLSFVQDEREMPVLWHQSLLTFAQRYKTSITREQKEAMKRLLRVHQHHIITPLVRLELFNSPSRGEV